MNRSRVNFEERMNMLERYINNGDRTIKEWTWAALVLMASNCESDSEKVRQAMFKNDNIVSMPEEAFHQRKFFKPVIMFVKFIEPKPNSTASPSMDSKLLKNFTTNQG